MAQARQSRSIVRGVSLPEPLNEALEKRAKRDDTPVSRVVQRALEQYLKTRKKPSGADVSLLTELKKRLELPA